MKATMDINNLIEKIIKIRIDNIIEESNLNEKDKNEIININNNIVKNNKQINKKKKERKDKILSAYNIFVKDANNEIKGNVTLHFLTPKIITNEIKDEKDNRERLRKLSIIWKSLDNKTIDKYKQLTKDNKFTNEKYNDLIGKSLTPKLPRKKSKELK
jgi:Zn-dependent metalloprotease